MNSDICVDKEKKKISKKLKQIEKLEAAMGSR